MIPVIVALCLVAGGRFWNPVSNRNIGWWLWSWLGSTLLAMVFAAAAFAVVGPSDTAAYADYNYLHFDRDAYATADQRRVTAGGPALDQTLYDLDGSEVQLSTLWHNRPVVIEFGSVSCPVFDSRNQFVAKIGIRASEIEVKLDFHDSIPVGVTAGFKFWETKNSGIRRKPMDLLALGPQIHGWFSTGVCRHHGP